MWYWYHTGGGSGAILQFNLILEYFGCKSSFWCVYHLDNSGDQNCIEIYWVYTNWPILDKTSEQVWELGTILITQSDQTRDQYTLAHILGLTLILDGFNNTQWSCKESDFSQGFVRLIGQAAFKNTGRPRQLIAKAYKERITKSSLCIIHWTIDQIFQRRDYFVKNVGYPDSPLLVLKNQKIVYLSL